MKHLVTDECHREERSDVAIFLLNKNKIASAKTSCNDTDKE